MDAINLLLSDNRGIYIPRDFVTEFDINRFQGIDDDDIDTCKNPEDEWYWEAWDSILNNASYTDDEGNEYTLHQDGDLWLICFELMTDEEKQNFGFEVED